MEVFLSPLAEKKLILVVEYIEETFSLKSKREFLKKFSKSIEQISQHPKSCPQSEFQTNFFKCIFTKQSTFYYRIKDNEIEIVTITDNRQDPEKVKVEIENYFG